MGHEHGHEQDDHAGHDHAGGHGHTHDHRGASKRQLTIVLGLTAAYMLVEVVAGLWTHSLALVADAGHMLTDAGGLALALAGIYLAEKPATPEHTYGLYRVEILTATVNAVVLLGLSAFVIYEAVGRLVHPEPVQGLPMLAVASAGLVLNAVSVYVLRQGADRSLNLKGAYFEVLSDAISSVGVIAAALVVWLTGWQRADAVVSIGIGLFIVPRTWKLLTEAVGVLLEGTPSDVSLPALREALCGVPGVQGIHDLHVWSLTSGVNAMSVHAVLADGNGHDRVLEAVRERVREAFRIGHVTVQVEGRRCPETHL